MKMLEKCVCKVAVPFMTILMIVSVFTGYGIIGHTFDHGSVIEGIMTFAAFCMYWANAVCIREKTVRMVKEVKEDA